MREIVFVGLPNVGKSTLVNALSGAHLRTGNQNGVTVSTQSVLCDGVSLTDLPGLYSLHPVSDEERVSLKYVHEHADSDYILVVEAEKLPSALALLPLLSGKRGMLVLTMYRSFQKRGGRIKLRELSARIGVPVYAVDSYRSREVSALKKQIFSEKWGIFRAKDVLIADIYLNQRMDKSLSDRIFFNPFFCLPFFAFAFVGAFYLTFANDSVGVWAKDMLQNLFCVRFTGIITSLLKNEIIRSLAVDGILVPLGSVLAFLPQIAMLYIFLQALEESGILSAFGFCGDVFLRKLSIGGKGLFCLLIGFGCTTQGIEITKGIPRLADKRRVLAALPYFSCSAKLPVYVTLLSSFFENPFLPALFLYLFGMAISLCILLLSEHKSREAIAEIPRFRVPAFRPFFKTLGFRLKGFVLKVGKVVALFSIAVWILSSFDFSFTYVATENSMLAGLCGWLKVFFLPIGVTDWQTAFALFGGIAAKENIAGLLSLFYPSGLPYSAHTAFALSVFVLLSPPCISAIAAEIRQNGLKRTLFLTLLRFLFALLISYVVYFISEVLF